MTNCFTQLYRDEAGFIVSAELVLVSTIGVLAMIVGLTEVAFAVNQELEDVASSFGSINQSYGYSGTSGYKGNTTGSEYWDDYDAGDADCDITCDNAPQQEGW